VRCKKNTGDDTAQFSLSDCIYERGSERLQHISHLEYAKADLEIYELIRNKIAVEEIEHKGIKLVNFPNVFSPKYFTDSFWFAEEVSMIVKDISLLEIGSGTGVVSLFAGLNGASIACTDINPEVVRNTDFNLKQHEISGQCLLGDLYAPLKPGTKFDYIFWNHPFFESDVMIEDILLRADFDYQYEGLKRYLAEGHKYLNSNGQLLLGTGNAARLERLEEICEELNLKTKILRTIVMPVHPGSELINDYRIYEIKNLFKKK
jgi:methylase of polypeptide subunit release factors